MRNWIHENEVNEVMNCKASVKNQILPGMGATMYCGSDRYPMVVVEVVSPKNIKVAHVYDEDENSFSKNDNIHMMPKDVLEKYNNMKDWEPCCGQMWGVKLPYNLRKNGRWMPKGKGMWETCSIHVGYADSYRDPCF